MRKVTIYIGGNYCSEGNIHTGGWTAIMKFGHREKKLSGGMVLNTLLDMDLQSLLVPLFQMKESCALEIHTDNSNLLDLVNGDVIPAQYQVEQFNVLKNTFQAFESVTVKLMMGSQYIRECRETSKIEAEKEMKQLLDNLAVGV